MENKTITNLKYSQLNQKDYINSSELMKSYYLKPDNIDKCKPKTILRQQTGRENNNIEQYIGIYDSNFGGLLGTTLGLNKK